MPAAAGTVTYPAGMSRPARVTILQLDPGCPPGRVAGWLADAGVAQDQVNLWEQEVPAVSALGDGVLVLGGRMSAHDRVEHPWLTRLRTLLADAHAVGVPTLGICLGHQILAESLGGRVVVGHPDGPEEGPVVLRWHPEAAADPLLGGLAAASTPPTVLEAHHDVVVTLPPGAVLLAGSEAFPHQAFRAGRSWGVQFHPEASPDLLGTWLTHPDADAVVAAARDADAEIIASGRALAESFAALATAASLSRSATTPVTR